MNAPTKYLKVFSKNLLVRQSDRANIIKQLSLDINDRVAQGETALDITASLGSPKKLADNLNHEFSENLHPQATSLSWIFLAIAGICILKNLSDLTSLYSIFYQPTFPSGTIACIAAFMLFGWCRQGSHQRFLIPAFISISGILLWILSCVSKVEFYLANRVIPLQILFALLEFTFISGVIFCIISLIYSMFCYKNY